MTNSLPLPAICAHGIRISSGWIGGQHVSGGECRECRHEMYGADGLNRCPHGLVNVSACGKCREGR